MILKPFLILTFLLAEIFAQSSTKPLKICSFNVQIFGEKKVSNPAVFNELVKILKPYDIALIQEIRDSSNTSIFKLLAELNKEAPNTYSVALSDRLGRSASKEQYAFIYQNKNVKLIAQYHYDDGDEKTGKDIFEREPFIVRFSAPTAAVKDFFIAGIHAIPDNVKTAEEIAALRNVYDDAHQRFSVEDGVIMGDMNADCGYFGKANKMNNTLRNDPRFVWLIGDDMDTTTKDSDCAYDRIIVAGKNMISHASKGEIVDFKKLHNLDTKTTLEVSDHYPVIFTIR